MDNVQTTALPTVDIVIPSLDEERSIGDCIAAIKQQDYPQHLVSLYVVIDACTTDRTREVAQAAGAIVIECRTSGTASVRNLGVKQGRGDLVGYLDAHCRVSPDWLKLMVRPFEDKSVGGCQGPFDVTYDSTLVQRFARYSAFSSDQRLRDHTINARFSPYPWLLGGNCMFRRVALQAVGAFRDCRSEDTDCSWRIFLLGYRFAYVSGARATHHDRASIFTYLKKHYQHGVGAAQLAYSYGLGGKREKKEKSQCAEVYLLDLLYETGSFVERLRQRAGRISLGKRELKPVEDRFRQSFLWSGQSELQISPHVVFWSADDDQTVVVHLLHGNRSVLDGVADLIFKQLGSGSDRLATCRAIDVRYGKSTDVQDDVDCFVKQLCQENIVLVHERAAVPSPEPSN